MAKKANFEILPCDAFARQSQVLEVAPISPAHMWREIKAGRFPAPVKLSERVTAWRVGDIRAWLASKAKA